MGQQEQTEAKAPELTGERLDPSAYPAEILQQHAARYVFAARFCHGKDVLDVASGLGYGTDYLRKQGARAVGLEIDEQSVLYSRWHYSSSTFVRGSAEAMPANWIGAYDVVVSFETIEHLDEPAGFVQEVFRCLRPGGLFICSSPNRSLYVFAGSNRFHVREFSYGEFLRMIGSRFRIIQVCGQVFHPRWHVPFMALRGLVRKVLAAWHVPPLGISGVATAGDCPSPFEGNSIMKERVLPVFLPAEIRRNSVPGFLTVVAEKSRE